MRRVWSCLIAVAVAASATVALSVPAVAQAGDPAAFCAARQEANSAETKAENKAVIEKVYAAAPAAAIPAITAIRDGFAKKGEKFFESAEGGQAIAELDAVVYEVCPGTKVPVRAIDYEYLDLPATLAAGPTKIKLTNEAPKEPHQLILFKLNEKGAALDPEKLLALPQGKAQKMVDPAGGAFVYAEAGQSGYGLVDLQPGEYLAACYLSIGGKKKGEAHWTEGMYATLTVS